MRRASPIVIAATLTGFQAWGQENVPANIAPNIPASYVSEARFDGKKCAALSDERAQLEAELSDTASQLRTEKGKYLLDIVFLNLPITTFRGDSVATEMAQEKRIARLKGEIQAISSVSRKKRCQV